MDIFIQKEKLTKLWIKMRRCWQLYLFLLLPVFYILLFAYGPMYGAQIAFKDFVASKGILGSKWVGIANFERFFRSFEFKSTVLNTVRISLYYLITAFPLAIAFSLVLNSVYHPKFKKLTQTVTSLPYFISTVVLVGMLMQVFNPIVGGYGSIYKLLGGAGYPHDILSKAKNFIHFYNWSTIWQELGWSTILYLAVLSTVDPQQHEAATVDGATRFQRIIHIDLPAILPTASIIFIISAGSIMNVGFEKAYLMQSPANIRYSEVLSTYIYRVGLTQGGGNLSYASAIGLFNSVINCSFMVVVNFIAKKIGSETLF